MPQAGKIAYVALTASLVAWLGASAAAAQSADEPHNSQPAVAGDALKAGFENPPQSARPRVWWHWMNGNISQEGIKLDLEWMHRVGLGGFHAWVNRLIGDQQPGATKITYADVKPYKADSPLLPSGLLGPVAIVRTSAQ